jgi:hypothetical protein
VRENRFETAADMFVRPAHDGTTQVATVNCLVVIDEPFSAAGMNNPG